MSQRISPKKRKRILELNQQSLTVDRIATQTNTAYRDVQNIILEASATSSETEEPIPSCYKLFGSVDNAINIALACQWDGVDSDSNSASDAASEVTAIICRKYQCPVDEFKKLVEWSRKHTATISKSSLEALESTVQDLKFSIDIVRADLEKAKLKLKELNAARAELTKQQRDLEHKNTKSKAQIEANKQKLNALIGGASTFRVMPEDRKTILKLISEAKSKAGVPIHEALEALCLDRNVYYKWRKDPDCEDHRTSKYQDRKGKPRPGFRPPNTLADEKVELVKEQLMDPQYAHLSIAKLHKELQLQGIHITSLSTYHRIARKNNLTRAVRKQIATSARSS